MRTELVWDICLACFVLTLFKDGVICTTDSQPILVTNCTSDDDCPDEASCRVRSPDGFSCYCDTAYNRSLNNDTLGTGSQSIKFINCTSDENCTRNASCKEKNPDEISCYCDDGYNSSSYNDTRETETRYMSSPDSNNTAPRTSTSKPSTITSLTSLQMSTETNVAGDGLKDVDIGLLAAICVGGIVVISLILALICLSIRNRRKKASRRQSYAHDRVNPALSRDANAYKAPDGSAAAS